MSLEELETVYDGCTDDTACNYDSDANVEDDSCLESDALGCTMWTVIVFS